MVGASIFQGRGGLSGWLLFGDKIALRWYVLTMPSIQIELTAIPYKILISFHTSPIEQIRRQDVLEPIKEIAGCAIWLRIEGKHHLQGC